MKNTIYDRYPLGNKRFKWRQKNYVLSNFAAIGPVVIGDPKEVLDKNIASLKEAVLMRFYDTTEGDIQVDGTPTRRFTRNSLRRNIGMVLQDTHLKHDTVRANIALGHPEATEEQIIEAAKACHAHSFIRRLPNGYDTVIGGDNDTLSQGQRQLLCIARVMLCLPPMLILDEATSSIDTRTEQKIQSAFARMMKGRTSFIVAHRLSTIKNADLILVMNDGNIVERGTHDTLLAKDGLYAKLYYSQFEE